MSFCKDLSSDENVHTLLLNVYQHSLPRIFPARTVAIDAHDPCVGEMLSEGSFHPLCSMTKRSDILIPAFRAEVWEPLLVPTVVTAQFFFAQVHNEAAGAAVAGGCPAA